MPDRRLFPPIRPIHLADADRRLAAAVRQLRRRRTHRLAIAAASVAVVAAAIAVPVAGVGSSAQGTAVVTAKPPPATVPAPAPPAAATTSEPLSVSSPPATPTTTASTGVPAAPAPPLGVKGAVFEGQGFGEVKPSEISRNGDPTSQVTGIVWSTWGGAHAIGTGNSTYVGPNQLTYQGQVEQATVVAFDLGTCDGTYVYQAVEWYFPQHGGQFNPDQYFNACTGQAAGSGSPSGAPSCTGGQLTLSTSAKTGAGGHGGYELYFNNSSAAPCTLTGYPSVAALTDGGQQSAHATETPRGYLGGLPPGDSAIPVVTLQPGQSAAAGLEWIENPQNGETTCPDYHRILVTPPNTTNSVPLAVPQLFLCAYLEVHPVQATPS